MISAIRKTRTESRNVDIKTEFGYKRGIARNLLISYDKIKNPLFSSSFISLKDISNTKYGHDIISGPREVMRKSSMQIHDPCQRMLTVNASLSQAAFPIVSRVLTLAVRALKKS